MNEIVGWFWFIIALVGLIVALFERWLSVRGLREKVTALEAENERIIHDFYAEKTALEAENKSLHPFRDIRDAAAEATKMREEAQKVLAIAKAFANVLRYNAECEANALRRKAQDEAETLRRETRAGNTEARRKADALITDANERAARLVSDAQTRAEEIAGDAYRALNQAEQLERTATAMRNVIDGYGDRYLKPTDSLLDQLAEDYEFDQAGRELKQARANSKSMVNSGRAAVCDYVEPNRRETAIRFVLDAFNGKVDTILSRVRMDNIGTLEQKVRDAFSLVNHNGGAFRNAQVTPEYLTSRLAELKWAVTVIALREREKEEQKRIREQIREEERARREIERALRDAAKEEEALQKAMAKVQAQVAKANDEQRVHFEEQLASLQDKLAEAEARNQRAQSMAQQTKAGHVYVISNIGSFGEQVFKVGMTRRLEPNDRIRELGDASVPFPFDVHAMIWADDAPALEYALHKRFIAEQVNKVNPRKEFFRVNMTDLRGAIEEMGIQAHWTITAAATQYRETLAIEQGLSTHTEEANAWLRRQLTVTQEEFAVEVLSNEV